MKTITNIILAVIFAISAVSATGQGNDNLFDPDKMWSSIEYLPWGGWYYKTYYNRFEGDTSINNIHYKKVWQAEDENHSDWYLFAFIRQDTTGSIYVRDFTGEEGLIYNFDLEVNDPITIHNPFYQIEYSTYVSNIDTVVLEPGGMSRKRLTIAPIGFGGKNEYWIEGVGSVAGILWSGMHAFSLTGPSNDLSCHWQNNQLVFKTDVFTQCFVTTVSVETHEAPEMISISPVPVTRQSLIRVEGLYGNNYRLEIWNMFGQRFMDKQIAGNEQVIIDRDQLTPGIYILVLQRDGRKIKTLKFSVL